MDLRSMPDRKAFFFSVQRLMFVAFSCLSVSSFDSSRTMPRQIIECMVSSQSFLKLPSIPHTFLEALASDVNNGADNSCSRPNDPIVRKAPNGRALGLLRSIDNNKCQMFLHHFSPPPLFFAVTLAHTYSYQSISRPTWKANACECSSDSKLGSNHVDLQMRRCQGDRHGTTSFSAHNVEAILRHHANYRKIGWGLLGANLTIETEKLKIQGEDSLTKYGDPETLSGRPVNRYFCKICEVDVAHTIEIHSPNLSFG